jgi:hypothetical protein
MVSHLEVGKMRGSDGRREAARPRVLILNRVVENDVR